MPRFSATVPELWEATYRPATKESDYVAQIRSRLGDVKRLHPSFFCRGKRIGSISIASLEELIDEMVVVEQSLAAPFTVLIHGDFNANNVIYDDEQDRIHFIDLYRSGDGDFLQDASVFLVSCLRLPVFDERAAVATQLGGAELPARREGIRQEARRRGRRAAAGLGPCPLVPHLDPFHPRRPVRRTAFRARDLPHASPQPAGWPRVSACPTRY